MTVEPTELAISVGGQVIGVVLSLGEVKWLAIGDVKEARVPRALRTKSSTAVFEQFGALGSSWEVEF